MTAAEDEVVEEEEMVPEEEAANEEMEVEAETEVDDPTAAKAQPLAGDPVGFSPFDATLDVIVSKGGVASSLSHGGFRHLLSGIRANVGAKGGRHLFEVRVLEHAPGTAAAALRVGVSTAGSSLFLGDGSADGACFDWDGNYHFGEPGAAAQRVPKACQKALGRHVVGVLVNLEAGSPNANTLSVFLNGKRAGKPQPLPVHLKGKALFPTITFKNLTLAANFGAVGCFTALPFACRAFACIDTKYAERSARGPPTGKRQVVLPVGLPNAHILDFADEFLTEHPDFVELSDRMVEDWCTRSGLKRQEAPGPLHSHDRPDFAFGIPALDGKSWRATLQTLAQVSQRNLLCVQLRSNLLRCEREWFLSSFPKSVSKSALVCIGEPSRPLKRLREDDGIPDISQKALACSYTKFALPSKDEGFDEVKYEWLAQAPADAHLKKWVATQKASLVVEGLTPSVWFTEKLKKWHELRKMLQGKHKEFGQKRMALKASGEDVDDDVLDTINVAMVTDVHDADGSGTPLYCHFKFEDWVLLAFRIELHLLAHAFLHDVADEDRPGIPEAHVGHYFQLYFKTKMEPAKLGVESLPQALKLLKEPAELVDQPLGGRVLKSKLEADVPWEDFVKAIEKYRRDRARRVDAGDESASLTFPRAAPKAAPAKGAGKGAPAKGNGKGAPATVPAKRPAPAANVAEEPEAKKARLAEAPVAKAPVAKAPVAKAPVAKAPVAKAPVAKAPVAKAPVAKSPVAKAPVSKAPVAKRKAV